MKKIYVYIVSAIVAATAIGSATVTAHAAEELTVTTMSELVAELVKEDHLGSITYQDEEGDFTVTYRWSIESKEFMQEWYEGLSVVEARMIVAEYGVSPEWVVDYYTGWHLSSTVSYHPFTTTLLT